MADDNELDELLDEMEQDFEDAIGGKLQSEASPAPAEDVTLVISDGDVVPEPDEAAAAAAAAAAADDEGVVTTVAEPTPAPVPIADELDDKAADAATATPELSELETLKKQMAEIVASNKKLQSQVDETAAAAEAAPTAEPAPEPEGDAYVDPMETLSDEQKATLENYTTEWEDVSKAENIMRKVLSERMAYLVTQVATAQQNQIDQLAIELDNMRSQLGFQSLSGKVDDLEGTLAKVKEWVETQPKFLQAGYKQALTSGSEEEKLELIELYTKANPAPAPTATTTTERRPAAPVEVVQTLSPVTTRRTGVPAASVDIDPLDEEGAFEDAIAKITG